MLPVGKDDVIEDEDEPWKQKKNDYYRQHFFPETDPTITKFTVRVSDPFHNLNYYPLCHFDSLSW